MSNNRRPQSQKPKSLGRKSEFRSTGPLPKGPRYNRAKAKRSFSED